MDKGAVRTDLCRASALSSPPPFIHAHPYVLQPLVREGRMDKWLFEPTREEMTGMLCPLFAPQLEASEVDVLLDAFPAQVGSWLVRSLSAAHVE